MVTVELDRVFQSIPLCYTADFHNKLKCSYASNLLQFLRTLDPNTHVESAATGLNAFVETLLAECQTDRAGGKKNFFNF